MIEVAGLIAYFPARELSCISKTAQTMKFLPLIGRVLFTAHFLISAPFHFTDAGVGYAESAGVPMANLLVPFSGIMAIVGALGVLLGYKARWAAWLLVLFLVPVNFAMNQFWTIADPMQQQIMMGIFLKDLSMTGGALLIAYFGSGPMSFSGSGRTA